MKPGPYILAEPIDNPLADGRVKNDWRRASQIPAGRYYVSTFVDEDRPGLTEVSVSDGRWRLSGLALWDDAERAARWRERVPKNAELTDTLLGALVRDDSLEGELRHAATCDYVQAHDVLLRLVRAGVVDRSAVTVAIAAEREDGDRA